MPDDATAILSAIRGRAAERAKTAPGFGAPSADFSRLLAAVEAVLKHHVEAVIEDMPAPPFRYCKTCSGHPKWPCPEVRAIRAALTGENNG